jgi:hypothetical protein
MWRFGYRDAALRVDFGRGGIHWNEEFVLEQSVHQPEAAAREPYEAPAILDTFDAQEVLGAAHGYIGQGSCVEQTL